LHIDHFAGEAVDIHQQVKCRGAREKEKHDHMAPIKISK
jgi:hypothetical protein